MSNAASVVEGEIVRLVTHGQVRYQRIPGEVDVVAGSPGLVAEGGKLRLIAFGKLQGLPDRQDAALRNARGQAYKEYQAYTG